MATLGTPASWPSAFTASQTTRRSKSSCGPPDRTEAVCSAGAVLTCVMPRNHSAARRASVFVSSSGRQPGCDRHSSFPVPAAHTFSREDHRLLPRRAAIGNSPSSASPTPTIRRVVPQGVVPALGRTSISARSASSDVPRTWTTDRADKRGVSRETPGGHSATAPGCACGRAHAHTGDAHGRLASARAHVGLPTHAPALRIRRCHVASTPDRLETRRRRLAFDAILEIASTNSGEGLTARPPPRARFAVTPRLLCPPLPAAARQALQCTHAFRRRQQRLGGWPAHEETGSLCVNDDGPPRGTSVDSRGRRGGCFT